MTFSVVLLSAGASSRMGGTKGLLPYRGGTLVSHSAETALASGASDVTIVLGAEAERIRTALGDLPVRTIVNTAWSEGMGSSIRTGVAALNPEAEAVVIALADQPLITSDHLRHLVEGLNCTPIVASSYDGVLGAPCAFRSEEFERLLALRGDAGARTLLRGGEASVSSIAFQEANLDIDTPAAYKELLAIEDSR